MKAAKKQIEKEIAWMQKKHDAIMNRFYKSQTEENKWGDGRIYEEADIVSRDKQLLIDALALIEKYETRGSN